MTNREALIFSLRIMSPDEKESRDALYEGPYEDWAPAESNVAYWVECPHHEGDKDLPCDGLNYPWSILDVCGPCKEAWLDEEVSE